MTNNNPDRLSHLIQLYFDGETTLEQERELRAMLADPKVTGEEADEARAVISFAVSSPSHAASSTVKPPSRKPSRFMAAVSVAASVAVVAMVGYGLFHPRNNAECMAYVDGNVITDSEVVMEMVETDLSALGQASSDVSSDITDDLDAISSALNLNM